MSGGSTILISVSDQAIEKILGIYDYNLKTLKRMQEKNQCLPCEAAEIMQCIKQCVSTLRSVQASYFAWEVLDGILDERLNALADKNQDTHEAVKLGTRWLIKTKTKLDDAEGQGRR